jgi:very-short-patch-repair endonuclease
MVREMLDELGVRYIEHDRSIIKPLELDFYIPDFQMAIEVNGIYWHSEQNGRDKYAHQRKTLRCLELGVSLIHLFEDQIVIDLEKIKRRLHENYISARGENLHFDGILEVDGCWPLPQWFSARPIGISSPRRYQVNSEFTKQNPTLWDSGTIYYESLQ